MNKHNRRSAVDLAALLTVAVPHASMFIERQRTPGETSPISGDSKLNSFGRTQTSAMYL